MNIERYSDERLVALHRQKKIAIFFVLYNRYRNYGYVVVQQALKTSTYFNALYEERDALLYDALMIAIKTFDKSRGTFRIYFGKVLNNLTIQRIRDFARDPIADYVSIDGGIKDVDELKYVDALTFADKGATPQELMSLKDTSQKVSCSYHGHNDIRIQKMVALKEKGYSIGEIAKHFHTTKRSVASIFYRVKKCNKKKKRVI
ncbi:MAG: hypothetical protein MJ207_01495 [Bacilli bacterium]|nr:hypothetical protein [Bacilli bacterium]